MHGVSDAGGGKVQISWKEGGGGSGRNLGHRVRTQRMLREGVRETMSAAKAARAHGGRGDGSKA